MRSNWYSMPQDWCRATVSWKFEPASNNTPVNHCHSESWQHLPSSLTFYKKNKPREKRVSKKTHPFEVMVHASWSPKKHTPDIMMSDMKALLLSFHRARLTYLLAVIWLIQQLLFKKFKEKRDFLFLFAFLLWYLRYHNGIVLFEAKWKRNGYEARNLVTVLFALRLNSKKKWAVCASRYF